MGHFVHVRKMIRIKGLDTLSHVRIFGVICSLLFHILILMCIMRLSLLGLVMLEGCLGQSSMGSSILCFRRALSSRESVLPLSQASPVTINSLLTLMYFSIPFLAILLKFTCARSLKIFSNDTKTGTVVVLI